MAEWCRGPQPIMHHAPRSEGKLIRKQFGTDQNADRCTECPTSKRQLRERGMGVFSQDLIAESAAVQHMWFNPCCGTTPFGSHMLAGGAIS